MGSKDMLLRQLVHHQDNPNRHLWTPHYAQAAFDHAGDAFVNVGFFGTDEMSKKVFFLVYLEYMKQTRDLTAPTNAIFQRYKQHCYAKNFSIRQLDRITGLCLQETPFCRPLEDDQLLRCFSMLTLELNQRTFSLNKCILQCAGAMASTIVINVLEEITESDLSHLKVFVDYAKKIQWYGFTSILQELVFVIHEHKGPKYGQNNDYLKTVFTKYSTSEYSFDLLSVAFDSCMCYTLPSVKDVTHSKDLPVDYMKVVCQFGYKHVCPENRRKSFAHWTMSERNGKQTFRRIERYMKSMNDGNYDLGRLYLEDTARHEYFRAIELQIEDYIKNITEGIRTMSVDTSYENITSNAQDFIFKKYEDFIKIQDFRHLGWYQSGISALGTYTNSYKIMFEDDFKRKLVALKRVTNNYKQLQRNDVKLSHVLKQTQSSHDTLPVDGSKTSGEMEAIFSKALEIYLSKMKKQECTCKDDVFQQHSLANDDAKQHLETALDPKFSQVVWDQQMLNFNLTLQEKRDAIISEIESAKKQENVMHCLQSNAVSSYRESMVEALFAMEEPFEECHKKCLKSGKRILSSSQLWANATLRKQMESQFIEKAEEEKSFLGSYFKRKHDATYFENEKKLAAKYHELMDNGILELENMQNFKALHGRAVSQAYQHLKLSKKLSKENGEMLRESLTPFKEKYLEMFELNQELKAAEARLKVLEDQKLASKKAVDCFVPPSALTFSMDKIIDNGNFRLVKKAWNDMHGNVTVQYINIEDGISTEQQMETLTEGVSLSRLANHDHVIRVLGHTRQGNEFGVLFEYVDGMDILPFLQYTRKKDFWLPPLANLRLCADIASAIHFLHSDPIFRVGDITIDDVMITCSLRAKVTGFKIGKFMEGNESRGNGAASLAKIIASIILREKWSGDEDWDRIAEESMACAETQEERKLCWALEDEIRLCQGESPSVAETRKRLLMRLESSNDGGFTSSDERTTRLLEYLLDAMRELDFLNNDQNKIDDNDVLPIL